MKSGAGDRRARPNLEFSLEPHVRDSGLDPGSAQKEEDELALISGLADQLQTVYGYGINHADRQYEEFRRSVHTLIT